MKCLIFSDSHGNDGAMAEAIRRNRDAEIVFFLGDGIRDAESCFLSDVGRTWFFVLGNCDFKTDVNGDAVRKTEELILFGKKIVFTHGDLYGVKYSDSGLRTLAESRGADIVLYGHTHKPAEDFVSVDGRGVWFFNPGSLEKSYSSSESFGVLTIDEKTTLFSHGTLKKM